MYVAVTGTSKKPELKFSSNPELEEADVVSLLVFGKTTDRLTGSEKSSLAEQGGGLAGSVAAGILERTLGQSLGLDTITIDSGRAGVGRYLTQDLYLTYERTYGYRDPTQDDRGGNTVGLEYTVNRNFKIKGTSSDIGENAVDFNWSYDY